jgi:hypothetical protein
MNKVTQQESPTFRQREVQSEVYRILTYNLMKTFLMAFMGHVSATVKFNMIIINKEKKEWFNSGTIEIIVDEDNNVFIKYLGKKRKLQGMSHDSMKTKLSDIKGETQLDLRKLISEYISLPYEDVLKMFHNFISSVKDIYDGENIYIAKGDNHALMIKDKELSDKAEILTLKDVQ